MGSLFLCKEVQSQVWIRPTYLPRNISVLFPICSHQPLLSLCLSHAYSHDSSLPTSLFGTPESLLMSCNGSAVPEPHRTEVGVKVTLLNIKRIFVVPLFLHSLVPLFSSYTVALPLEQTQSCLPEAYHLAGRPTVTKHHQCIILLRDRCSAGQSQSCGGSESL